MGTPHLSRHSCQEQEEGVEPGHSRRGSLPLFSPEQLMNFVLHECVTWTNLREHLGKQTKATYISQSWNKCTKTHPTLKCKDKPSSLYRVSSSAGSPGSLGRSTGQAPPHTQSSACTRLRVAGGQGLSLWTVHVVTISKHGLSAYSPQ